MDGASLLDGESMIGTYPMIRYADPADAYRPYDDRFPLVAGCVAQMIRRRLPGLVVEHIGSSAIPGCAGKGVVDLMAVYGPGELEAARQAVDGLGFQRYTAPGAHPEDRPVRLGTLTLDGETFRLHVHVIAADNPEVADQRHFRDTLRERPDLVAMYESLKLSALTVGVRDSNDYNDAKDAFIKAVMALPR